MIHFKVLVLVPLIFLFLTIPVSGQRIILQHPSEPAEIHQLSQKARDFFSSNPDSVYLITEQIIALIDSNKMPYTFGHVLMSRGLAKNTEGKWVEAEQYFKQTLPQIRKIGDSISVANTLDYMGYSLLYQGYINKHLEQQLKVLEYREKFEPDSNMIARSYSILGSIYYKLGNLDQALSHYLRTFKIRKKLSNLPSYYLDFTLRNLGNVYRKQQKYEAAETQYLMALDSFKIGQADGSKAEVH